ncbi:MAG TPA: response regulator transcription factor [Opitutaceae bacterium]
MDNQPHVPETANSPVISVAIIEDDAFIRQLLAGWLQGTKGFVVVGQFSNAESAIPEILTHQPNIVISDINLPGVSGIACVQELKAKLPDTQFVMLTIYEDTDHIFKALSAGATGYLSKKTPRGDLIDALHELHAGGSPMSSPIARKVVQSFRQQPESPRQTPELSPREKQVLERLARGDSLKYIAGELGVGMATVGTYVRRIYEKLQVHSRGQAVAIYANIPLKKSE